MTEQGGGVGGGPAPEAATDSRHDAFLARHLARHAKVKSAKEDGEEGGLPGQSVTDFWSEFNERHQSMRDQLGELQAKSAAGEAGGGAATNARLDELVAQAQQLQAATASAAIYLPAYDVRRAGEEAAKALVDVEAARAALVPRKKFAFKSRTARPAAGAAAAAAAAPPPPATAAAPPLPQTSTATATAAAAQTSTATATATSTGAAAQEEWGFSGREGETLVWGAGAGGGGAAPARPKGMRDFTCGDLVCCTLLICDVLDALRLRGLRNCRVYVGPVRGSVYAEGCSGCTIVAACRQLRIHATTATDFHVHTLSGPIIEGCSGVRFAPYELSYPGLQAQMAEAQLLPPPLPSPPGGSPPQGAQAANAWRDVKDFLWHKPTQSPNWSILPEGERFQKVEVEGHPEVEVSALRGGAAGGVQPVPALP